MTVGLDTTGSSPLTRGALTGVQDELGVTGIIPAYAGSTSSCRVSTLMGKDHPRLRGEHPGEVSACCALRGDHPRLRGEHCMAAMCSLSALGSSPLTRGAPSRWSAARDSDGIIPAYAGSTQG